MTNFLFEISRIRNYPEGVKEHSQGQSFWKEFADTRILCLGLGKYYPVDPEKPVYPVSDKKHSPSLIPQIPPIPPIRLLLSSHPTY